MEDEKTVGRRSEVRDQRTEGGGLRTEVDPQITQINAD